ncbi:unnamed protein product [Soboliphyme baturini]|uniref:RRM domain-containing protein n=1 Tax=Soboliphyme baturini TaxID=241478 RepID=A0A183IAU9_9BILA|nr:unnamed protein product [Soboliphyme baturini]
MSSKLQTLPVMPIVQPDRGGLRRYAVFAFVENQTPDQRFTASEQFHNHEHVGSKEVTVRVPDVHTMHMKRLKSLESRVYLPFVDMTFFSSYRAVEEMQTLISAEDCVDLKDPEIKFQKGCFEELQLVDLKHGVATETSSNHGAEKKRASNFTEVEVPLKERKLRQYKTRGFLVAAYKTMEHTYNREFASSWKTWTGVRYICMQLPKQVSLRRVAFYRQIGTTSDFTYVLVMEVDNLLLYASQTLNLVSGIRLRLCGYTAVYYEDSFNEKMKPGLSYSRATETNAQVEANEQTCLRQQHVPMRDEEAKDNQLQSERCCLINVLADDLSPRATDSTNTNFPVILLKKTESFDSPCRSVITEHPAAGKVAPRASFEEFDFDLDISETKPRVPNEDAFATCNSRQSNSSVTDPRTR